MSSRLQRERQRGATLLVGLIMLALITLLVTSAFNANVGNLKAVGNMQRRMEAVAAGNKALEQVLASPFTDNPAADQILVDIDQDGRDDYLVQVARPACISAARAPGSNNSGIASSLSLGLPAAPVFWNTVWDLSASVTETGSGSAAVQVHQGVRVLLSQARYEALCT